MQEDDLKQMWSQVLKENHPLDSENIRLVESRKIFEEWVKNAKSWKKERKLDDKHDFDENDYLEMIKEYGKIRVETDSEGNVSGKQLQDPKVIEQIYDLYQNNYGLEGILPYTGESVSLLVKRKIFIDVEANPKYLIQFSIDMMM